LDTGNVYATAKTATHEEKFTVSFLFSLFLAILSLLLSFSLSLSYLFDR